MPQHIDVVVYLQVEGKRSPYGPARANGTRAVNEARVVAMTQKRPERPKANTFVTKVRLRVDPACFDPLEPTAVVLIEPGQTEAIVEVEATHPEEDS